MTDEIVKAKIVFQEGANSSISSGSPAMKQQNESFKNISKDLGSLNNNFSKFISGSATGLLSGGSGMIGNLVSIALKNPTVVAAIAGVAAIVNESIQSSKATESRLESKASSAIITTAEGSEKVLEIEQDSTLTAKEKETAIRNTKDEYALMSVFTEDISQNEAESRIQNENILRTIGKRFGLNDEILTQLFDEGDRVKSIWNMWKGVNEELEKRNMLLSSTPTKREPITPTGGNLTSTQYGTAKEGESSILTIARSQGVYDDRQSTSSTVNIIQ